MTWETAQPGSSQRNGVRKVADALKHISGKDAMFRRDQVWLMGLDDDLEDKLNFFARLVQYYSEAAARGNALLLDVRREHRPAWPLL